MQLLKVKGTNSDFAYLCRELEKFQFDLMPVLKDKEYNLTDDLDDIIGFILYDNKIAIGSIGLKKLSNESCEIVRVFVNENYRGRGYAKILFENIEQLAKDLGYKKAELAAWSKAKSALKLYDKLGYISGKEKESEWFEGLKYFELYKNF